jgi:hypothetical protein
MSRHDCRAQAAHERHHRARRALFGRAASHLQSQIQAARMLAQATVVLRVKGRPRSPSQRALRASLARWTEAFSEGRALPPR